MLRYDLDAVAKRKLEATNCSAGMFRATLRIMKVLFARGIADGKCDAFESGGDKCSMPAKGGRVSGHSGADFSYLFEGRYVNRNLTNNPS